MCATRRLASAALLMMSLFSLLPANSSTSAQTRKRRVTGSLTRTRSLSRSEISQAETHLSEMGYGKGRDALVAFEKYEGRKVTSQLPAGENHRSDCFFIQTTSAMDSRFTAILPSLKLHRVTDAFAFPCPRRLRLADHCPRARSC